MGIEIERKFLVRNSAWRGAVQKSVAIRQGYLAESAECVVRVRTKGRQAFLTIKGSAHGVLSRPEFEYEVPVADAEELLAGFCRPPLIEKTRHIVQHGGKTWEVDEFFGANAGLVVAEIELAREDEGFGLPEWAGEEVTHDVRYANASLARQPMPGGKAGGGS